MFELNFHVFLKIKILRGRGHHDNLASPLLFCENRPHLLIELNKIRRGSWYHDSLHLNSVETVGLGVENENISYKTDN